MKYQDINSKAIDSWVEDGWIWGKPISHETYLKALKGDYDILLTPTKPVPHEWIGNVKGKKVLGLACGGAQQMPIMCALGAITTCLDYSNKQLESERIMAEKEGYHINTIRHDMTKGLPFNDEEFDLIIAPVSVCYIEDVAPLFKEAYRILKTNGVMIIGLDNGINFISNNEERIENTFPFNPLKNPEQMEISLREGDSVQFSHSTEDQIGGLLKAGFTIKDIYDDINEEGRLHDLNIPAFYALKVIK